MKYDHSTTFTTLRNPVFKKMFLASQDNTKDNNECTAMGEQ